MKKDIRNVFELFSDEGHTIPCDEFMLNMEYMESLLWMDRILHQLVTIDNTVQH